MFKKKWSTLFLSAALFCAGGACGWLMRGNAGGTGVPPAQPDNTIGSQVSPNGRNARSPDEEDIAVPQFVAAVSDSDRV